MSPQFINQLIRGKVTLSPDTAILLASVLGAPADFWLRREADYRSALAQQEERLRLTEQIGWLSELPVSDMAKRGWIRRLKDKAELVAECLRFFGVSSVVTWRLHYEQPLGAFRASPSFTQQQGAVAAWLRRAELEATKLDVARFDGAAFKRELHSLRSLTLEPNPQVSVPQLVERCAVCGVAVVFVPAPTGCRASGATSWLGPGKAMLVLSLRHKTDDQLWFTFFHEGFHLVLHGRDMLFVEGLDGLDSAQELEANQAAADLLIPPKQASRLAACHRNRSWPMSSPTNGASHRVSLWAGCNMMGTGIMPWAAI